MDVLNTAHVALSALLFAALLGCTGAPEPRPEPPTEAELKARVKGNSLDPWPHHGLARLYEERGDYEAAILEYGSCINLLPPRSATRPMLDLGVLHHRLGSVAPAERCYREVLTTVASDARSYADNDDYKVAALGLAKILAERGADAERARLERRFLDELGGDPGQWERGALWLTPLGGEGEAGR